jgi:hypothetical protein
MRSFISAVQVYRCLVVPEEACPMPGDCNTIN